MTAGNESDGLFVVHGHALERLTNIAGREQGIGVTVRAFGVHVDETHLHGAEGIGQLAVAAVALVAEPGRFWSPVDAVLGLPGVLSSTREAVGRKAHRLECAVTREDQQVGPRDLLAVLLFDGPEQSTSLIEADVVGPTVERRESLHSRSGSAAAVADAIGARAVPGHANEERAVVTEVGRPPGL